MYKEQAERRFWNKVQVLSPSECWSWLGALDLSGYGQVHLAGKLRKAHRVAWELENMALIPAGVSVYRTCSNKRCCNPNHLQLGAPQKVRTYTCAQGEKHRNSRLTKEQVLQIRQKAVSASTYATLAKEYGVTSVTIGNIVSGRSWKSAEGPLTPTDRRVGAENRRAKLSSEDVKSIRRLAIAGASQVLLAENFGISQGTVSNILQRKSWKHVT